MYQNTSPNKLDNCRAHVTKCVGRQIFFIDGAYHAHNAIHHTAVYTNTYNIGALVTNIINTNKGFEKDGSPAGARRVRDTKEISREKLQKEVYCLRRRCRRHRRRRRRSCCSRRRRSCRCGVDGYDLVVFVWVAVTRGYK
jgi:hypothetical protein